MNLAPGPALLESYRAQPHSWNIICGELIDNSFDASATGVEIHFGGNKSLDVIDDGNGCSDISKMLTLGAHFRQSTTRLGRFGVGLKEAAACLWGTLTIETTHKGLTRTAMVDWSALSKKSDWMIPDPVARQSTGKRGTTLKFRNIARNYPSSYEKLAEELGYTFMPALQSGRQVKISFKKRQPILCKPYQLPPLQNVVATEIEVDGKRVSIHAGIVEIGHVNRRPGFAFVYGHRVIMNSSLGSNGFSTARVSGIIELKSGWTLSKNKTSLIDNDEALADAIYYELKDMLALAQNQAITLTGEAFTKELNERFHVALGALVKSQNKKERRDKPSPENKQEGTVEKKDSGRKRTPRKTQPGSRLANEAESFARGGKIDWRPFDNDTFGEVDLAGSVIWLNENNKTLLAYRSSDNKDAVLNVAMGVFVAEVFHHEQRDKFPMFKTMDRFAQAWATTMATCAEAVQSTSQQPAA